MMNSDKKGVANSIQSPQEIADRIYHEWDTALATLTTNNVDALLALYSEDAVLESPLIPHLLGMKSGICRGAHEIRKLLEIVAQRKPAKRQYHRVKYFTDGDTLIWEYPRISPKGEQMDFVEVMELKNGLIQYHRVYWGWCGFNVLKNNQYF